MKTIFTLFLLNIGLIISAQVGTTEAKKVFNVGKVDKYTHEEIYQRAEKFPYAKDSIFDATQKIREKHLPLLRMETTDDVDLYLSDKNDFYKRKFELYSYKEELKKIKTTKQFFAIQEKYNVDAFKDAKRGTKEYDAKVEAIKQSKIVVYVDAKGSIILEDRKNVQPNAKIVPPKGYRALTN
jgi:hypothetical protein